MPKFGTKNAIFRNFWPKIHYLGIYGQELKKKLLSDLKSAPSKMPICKFSRKNKNAKIWDQKCLIWVFWVSILENFCHIWNHHLWICLLAKFCEETKMPKFGTKNDLFEYFWPKMPYLGIFGLELKKLLSYLKSAPLN